MVRLLPCDLEPRRNGFKFGQQPLLLSMGKVVYIYPPQTLLVGASWTEPSFSQAKVHNIVSIVEMKTVHVLHEKASRIN